MYVMMWQTKSPNHTSPSWEILRFTFWVGNEIESLKRKRKRKKQTRLGLPKIKQLHPYSKTKPKQTNKPKPHREMLRLTSLTGNWKLPVVLNLVALLSQPGAEVKPTHTVHLEICPLTNFHVSWEGFPTSLFPLFPPPFFPKNILSPLVSQKHTHPRTCTHTHTYTHLCPALNSLRTSDMTVIESHHLLHYCFVQNTMRNISGDARSWSACLVYPLPLFCITVLSHSAFSSSCSFSSPKLCLHPEIWLASLVSITHFSSLL